MKYKIKYKNKSYIVKAKDTRSALDGLSVIVPELSDERLSPMTYKKLKELGYSHETWKNLTQEKANKIVQQNEPKTEKKTNVEFEPKPMDIKSHVGEIIKKFGTDKNTEINKITKNDDGSYNISIHLERDSFPYQEFDADIKNRANDIFKELKNSLKGKFNITKKNLFKGSYIHGVPNELSVTITPEESDKPVSGGGNGSGNGPKDPSDTDIIKTVKKYNDSLLSKYNVKESDLPKPKENLAVRGADVLWGLIKGGVDISIDDIINHPVVRQTKQKLDSLFGEKDENGIGKNETININTPERQKLRQQIADKVSSQGSIQKTVDTNGKKHMSYSGPVDKGYRAEIVIGVPAGGKSSVIVDKVSQNTHSRVLDSDDIKKDLPEYDGGNGAGLVHKESADDILTKRVMSQFNRGGKHNGDNIVIPIVGKNIKAASKYLKALKDAGYKVHLSFNDVSDINSAKRSTTRFLETGRFLDPEYIKSVGSHPQETYEALKKGVDGIHFDSYTRYNNNVKFGQPAEKVERLDGNGKPLKWEDWQ